MQRVKKNGQQNKNKRISTPSSEKPERHHKKKQKNGLTKKTEDKSTRLPKPKPIQISEPPLPELSFSDEISKIVKNQKKKKFSS